MRAVLRFELGRREGIEADLRWLLDKEPDGIDLDKVDALRRRLEQPE
jgi:hypothetical protein